MHEKDPFGDKLREKERADEDLYFAKRDRELLEKLRGGDDAAASARQLARGRCPQCGSPLGHRVVDDIAVDECPSGHGLWLNPGELATLSRRESESWLGRFFRHSLVQTR